MEVTQSTTVSSEIAGGHIVTIIIVIVFGTLLVIAFVVGIIAAAYAYAKGNSRKVFRPKPAR